MAIINPPPEGLMPWHVGNDDSYAIFDKNNRLIGEMDTPVMSQFVVDCVNYIWKTDDNQEEAT
jgi:hypothetical protein